MTGERKSSASARSARWPGAADAVAAVGGIGLGWAAARLFAFPYDDAFIHLRIARNLAERGQPYFNLGEPILGGSSPLWTLLLAGGFSALGAASLAFVGALEGAIVAAVAVVAHRLLAGPREGTAVTAAAALLATSTLVSSAGGGMETPLALLLLTAAALAMARERFTTAGILLALGGACRYELFVAAPAALLAAPRGRRARLAAAFTAVAAAEALWLLASYGTVIPNTMRAKSVVYRLTEQEFLDQVAAGYGRLLLLSLFAVGAGLALGPALWRAARASIPERRALAVLGALPAALTLVYAAQRPMIFPWYWPLVLFPAALGLAIAGTRWPAVWAAAPPGRARWLALAGASLVAAAPSAAVVAGAIETARDVRAVVSGRLEGSEALVAAARSRTYLELGAALERCRPARVLAAEIGALGWTYRGPIVDGVGLVSPEVLRYHPLRVPDERVAGTVGAYPARAVADLRPDLVVALEIFNTDFARKAPLDPALRRYALVAERPVFSSALAGMGLPAELWWSKRVLVLGDPSRCPAIAPDR